MAKLRKVKKSKGKDKAAKRSFDLQQTLRAFNSLDMQNPGSWPLVVKLVLSLLVLALILALALAVPVRNKMADIKAAEAEEKTLLETYREKESKARNLQAYKDQVKQMEVTFAELLDQLPKTTKIPDLVEDINMRGVGSGIRFKDISVAQEVSRELFIEQPIEINAQGDYHEFGNFVSGIAGLSRIITMENFSVQNTSPDNLTELPELSLQLSAKTYRSKEQGAEQAEGEE